MGGELMTVILASGGSAGLTFITMWMSSRSSREARFEARYDERFKALEVEVDECRKERAQVMVVMMSFRMIVPELQRLSPGNPVLKQVSHALSALPVEPNSSLDDLIQQLNAIPYNEPSSVKAARDGGA